MESVIFVSLFSLFSSIRMCNSTLFSDFSSEPNMPKRPIIEFCSTVVVKRNDLQLEIDKQLIMINSFNKAYSYCSLLSIYSLSHKKTKQNKSQILYLNCLINFYFSNTNERIHTRRWCQQRCHSENKWRCKCWWQRQLQCENRKKEKETWSQQTLFDWYVWLTWLIVLNRKIFCFVIFSRPFVRNNCTHTKTYAVYIANLLFLFVLIIKKTNPLSLLGSCCYCCRFH